MLTIIKIMDLAITLLLTTELTIPLPTVLLTIHPIPPATMGQVIIPAPITAILSPATDLVTDPIMDPAMNIAPTIILATIMVKATPPATTLTIVPTTMAALITATIPATTSMTATNPRTL